MGNFSPFLSSAAFFKIIFIEKILSGALSESQIVWVQIMTDVFLVLIWVPNCLQRLSLYQQLTKVAVAKERVKDAAGNEQKYETCAILHRFHILHISCGCNVQQNRITDKISYAF